MPKVWQSVLVLGILIASIAVGILVFDADAHVPMLVGVAAAAIMALFIGYRWEEIERFMVNGISKSLQSVTILLLIGVLVGVWILAGIVPSMIYYGLAVLKPQIFFLATLIICSISSLATGSSWGTMGTMGVALLGIGYGLGMNVGITAGAIISGAYFGDKLSPLSDTTNLAPSMAGTDVMTHIKHMLPSTLVAYVISAIFFTIMGFVEYKGGAADLSQVDLYMNTIKETFYISPVLFIPPIIVITAIAFKLPAIPGIALGVVVGAIFGLIFQPGCTLGEVFTCGMNGYSADTAVEAINNLLTNGGIMNMTFAITLIIIAMAFGGIMEETHLLGVLVDKIKKLAKTPGGLVTMTEITCIASNVVVPDQYISIIIPGRMYAEEFRNKELSPSSLSNALESAGTVTSALVPWNTCGAYIQTNLGVSVAQYGPWAVFNWLMPLLTIAMAYLGFNVKDKDGVLLYKKRKQAKALKKAQASNE
ncbi:MAG: Na+/H+ antiporter NhaC [Bacilli bacterium]|nr:Na+/H+ antiporter NhaC [Bacilli bacterium]